MRIMITNNPLLASLDKALVRFRIQFIPLFTILAALHVVDLKAQSVYIALPGDGCAGSTYDFQFNTCTGCTFTEWQITGNYTIVENTGSVIMLRWNVAGTFQVSVRYLQNGQSKVTSPVSVTIHTPTVSIVGPIGSTPGSTETYTTTTNNSYNWMISGGTLVSGQGTNTITVAWGTSGTKYVSLYGGNGYCPRSVNLMVHVSSIPVPDIMLATNITSTTFNANWSGVAGVTSYRLEVATDSEFSPSSFLPGYTASDPKIVTGTSHPLTGLENLTMYYYRVRAITQAGLSNYSNPQSIRTDPDETYLYTGAGGDITPSSIKISYGMINLPETRTYQLQVSSNSNFSAILEEITVTAVTGQWDVTGLNQNTTYYLRTRLLFTNGTWSPFDVRDPITTYSIPPAPLLHSNHSYFTETSFMALWNAVPVAHRYKLDVALDEEFTEYVEGYQSLLITGSDCCGDNRLWYEIKGLEGGKTYYYRLRTVNSQGISSINSNTASITTKWPSVNHQTKNMIITRTPLNELDDEDVISNPTSENVQIQVAYFDGLGRPMQEVNWQASPQGYDMVTPIVYDGFGRVETKYMPYISSSNKGFYNDEAISDHASFYQDQFGDNKGYSKTIFEPSPLNRVLKQGAPGTTWQPMEDPQEDRSVKLEYKFNQSQEVLLLGFNKDTEDITFGNTESLYYEPNMLFANKTIDEHNNEVVEYKDKEGKTILKKVQYGQEGGVKLYASTYYIYDDYGNLVVVLPPEAVKALTSN